MPRGLGLRPLNHPNPTSIDMTLSWHDRWALIELIHAAVWLRKWIIDAHERDENICVPNPAYDVYRVASQYWDELWGIHAIAAEGAGVPWRDDDPVWFSYPDPDFPSQHALPLTDTPSPPATIKPASN